MPSDTVIVPEDDRAGSTEPVGGVDRPMPPRGRTESLGAWRVVCAADIGTVVNPGIVAQQMEGAVIFALYCLRSPWTSMAGAVIP